jgi:hypothetical protein
MTTFPAHEVLRGLFDEIIKEAERNPAFAQRMLAALPKGVVAELRKSAPATRRARPAAADVNPIKLLREDGEVSLRQTLDQLLKADLGKVARTNQLDLPSSARGKSATKTAIIDGIVEAAAFRLRERAA